MQRICSRFAMMGVALVLGTCLVHSKSADGALLRPDAPQSFPDLAGDIVGTQTYTYDPSTQTGQFQINNTPSILALGNQPSQEYFVTDGPNVVRSQALQIKLDSSGHLVNDPGNSFSIYGSVNINGQTLSGLLLQGTPTAFGFANPDPQQPTKGFYDVNLSLTGGLLKSTYGNDAYMSIIAETNSTFTGSFAQSFLGLKAMTNVRSYSAPNPPPIPEPSTFAILLAVGGAGWIYKHRRRLSIAALMPNASDDE